MKDSNIQKEIKAHQIIDKIFGQILDRFWSESNKMCKTTMIF